MSTSVRLKPDIAVLLANECKRQGKTRTDLIHEALAAYLPVRTLRLGDVIGQILAQTPGGWGLVRQQPHQVDEHDWTG